MSSVLSSFNSQGASYLQTQKYAANHGKNVASNKSHHEYLNAFKSLDPNDARATIIRSYPAWAGELLAYTTEDGKFKKKQDIKDSKSGWILPYSDIAKLVFNDDPFNTKNIQLLIVPQELAMDKGRLVVVPKSILVKPAMNKSGNGKYDAESGLVLPIPDKEFTQLPAGQKASFSRLEEQSIRPIVRGHRTYDGKDFYARLIQANQNPYSRRGMIFERDATAEEKIAAKGISKQEAIRLLLANNPDLLKLKKQLDSSANALLLYPLEKALELIEKLKSGQ